MVTSRLYLYAIKAEDLDHQIGYKYINQIMVTIINLTKYCKINDVCIMLGCGHIVYHLQLNITFEYIVACIVGYQTGSFLAFIVFPALIFVNIGVMRYIFYGIMATWSINLDVIADEIMFEQQKDKAKQRAFRGASLVSASNSAITIWDDEKKDDDDKEEQVVSSPNQQEPALIHRGDTLAEEEMGRWKIFTDTVAKFTSQYWMAVHWRLLTIFCCVLATIFAVPSISEDIQQSVNASNVPAASV